MKAEDIVPMDICQRMQIIYGDEYDLEFAVLGQRCQRQRNWNNGVVLQIKNQITSEK